MDQGINVREGISHGSSLRSLRRMKVPSMGIISEGIIGSSNYDSASGKILVRDWTIIFIRENIISNVDNDFEY